jgi:hypothetical protein
MAEYTKTVPINPGDPNATLGAVMDMIIFMTQDSDEFIKYDIESDQVVLTFEAVK